MIENTITTNENLVQDNSPIECVSPETNPIATTTHSEQLFDFHAEHNGEACIESLDPKDRGTERRFRFTRALLCTLLGVKSQDTITNHVDKLLKRGVIEVTKFLVTSPTTRSNRTVRYFVLCYSRCKIARHNHQSRPSPYKSRRYQRCQIFDIVDHGEISPFIDDSQIASRLSSDFSDSDSCSCD